MYSLWLLGIFSLLFFSCRQRITHHSDQCHNCKRRVDSEQRDKVLWAAYWLEKCNINALSPNPKSVYHLTPTEKKQLHTWDDLCPEVQLAHPLVRCRWSAPGSWRTWTGWSRLAGASPPCPPWCASCWRLRGWARGRSGCLSPPRVSWEPWDNKAPLLMDSHPNGKKWRVDWSWFKSPGRCWKRCFTVGMQLKLQPNCKAVFSRIWL